MLKSSFFQLLLTLSDKEIKAFYQFSTGAFFTQKVQLRLLDYILAGWSQKRIVELTEAAAYQATFQHALQTEKQRKKLFNTLSDLNGWLLDYLVWNEIKKEPTLKAFLQAKVYQKRGLKDKFYKVIEKAKKDCNKVFFDFWKPLKLMLLGHFYYFNDNTEKKNLAATGMSEMMSYLDDFYFLCKLRYGSELINRENLLAEVNPILFIKEVQQAVKQPKSLEMEHLQLYYWLTRLLEERTDEAFQKVKNYFISIPFLDKLEEQDTLYYLINHATYSVRKGKNEYILISFLLFKIGLEKQLLYNDGAFSRNAFKSIVNIACDLREFDWAEQFIEDYSDNLIAHNAEIDVNVANARVLIGQKDFGPALTLLAQLHSNIFYVERQIRSLQIICLYELKENEELIRTKCTNLMVYLKRSNIANQDTVLSSINFVKVVKKLQRKESKAAILKFLEKEKLLSYRSWVVEWVGRLKE